MVVVLGDELVEARFGGLLGDTVGRESLLIAVVIGAVQRLVSDQNRRICQVRWCESDKRPGEYAIDGFRGEISD